MHTLRKPISNKTRVLITGTSGMLGGVLESTWKDKFELLTVSGRAQFDFETGNYEKLYRETTPDVVIHAAALTNLEYCENNPRETLLVNGSSVEKLISSMPKVKIIFISSEAVFPPNTKNATENTPTHAQTVYGKSKELGENHLIAAKIGAVVRTTIVGRNINKQGNSLTEWIVSSLNNKQSIALFDDVWFTPISIWHLADALEWVIKNETPKILHIAGGERVTKHQFGSKLAIAMGLDEKLITVGKLRESGLKAKRSNEMSLDSSLYEKLSGRKLPRLNEVIEMIVKSYNA
jgi:dTDP-4-dehydrorhamnose reductase